jgi:hypothetical protein
MNTFIFSIYPVFTKFKYYLPQNNLTMYIIRDVFKCKPGKAKELVKKFKAASPIMLKTTGMKSTRVMTDAVATYWTVVLEIETENLSGYFDNMGKMSSVPEFGEIMAGYMDLVEGGHREIFKVE